MLRITLLRGFLVLPSFWFSLLFVINVVLRYFLSIISILCFVSTLQLDEFLLHILLFSSVVVLFCLLLMLFFLFSTDFVPLIGSVCPTCAQTRCFASPFSEGCLCLHPFAWIQCFDLLLVQIFKAIYHIDGVC